MWIKKDRSFGKPQYANAYAVDCRRLGKAAAGNATADKKIVTKLLQNYYKKIDMR